MIAAEHKWSSIFNRDHYPTPVEVLEMMQLNIAGETILEPSAGAGNIIEYCKRHFSKHVLFCEINDDLAAISRTKAKFLKSDFMVVTADDISHVTQIIMNPPFSRAAQHIEHAWEIAPAGCEITSLCNSEMLRDIRYDRKPLHRFIEEYGSTYDIGQVFSTADRKTDVEISVVKLYKPCIEDSEIFEGFYMDAEPEMHGENGIMHYNEVLSLVNKYIAALRCFEEFKTINEKMIGLCSGVGMGDGFSYCVSYDKQVTSKEDFAKHLQKKSWEYIFNKMNLDKYLTSGVMKDINRFVENQTNIPFTVKNVYRMFDIVIGTKEHNFKRALEEAVDSFTQHTHENRYYVEGWKTNSGHMLNKKFIIDYVFEIRLWGNGRLQPRISSNLSRLNDLVKVLCNLTGTDYNSITTVEMVCRPSQSKVPLLVSDTSQKTNHEDGIEPNRWYDCTFFQFKGFKKSTIHVKFKDEKVWELLNRKYAEIKGQVLPEKI